MATSIKVVSRVELKAIMERHSRASFGCSTRTALRKIRSGELPDSLAASNLKSLDVMLKAARTR